MQQITTQPSGIKEYKLLDYIIHRFILYKFGYEENSGPYIMHKRKVYRKICNVLIHKNSIRFMD